MLFATGTTAPHVPFEDRTFDLIYCGSVFTHISELAEAWLLELRRILRPGGYVYVTIHTRHTIDLLLTRYREEPLLKDLAGIMHHGALGRRAEADLAVDCACAHPDDAPASAARGAAWVLR
jgi:SAM-dependent methyltransferase